MDRYNKDEEVEKLLTSNEEMTELKNVFLRSHFPMPDIEEEWSKIADEIQDEPRRRSYLYIIGIAIGVAACLVLVFLLTRPNVEQPANIAMMATVEQNNAVTYTKDNGEVVQVDTSEISFVSTLASKNRTVSEGKMLSMVTPRGKDCHLVLPDGTKVWLNNDSKLDFPSSFGNGKRVVRLRGEAYFEVVKDKHHPFVVENEYFTTTVLGTVFNIRAYDEKNANIILVSGRVALKTGLLSETTYLKPGQMAVCNGRNQWNIHDEDTYPYTQRKEGYFYFNHLSLHQIMAEIGRWYNKTVVFENVDVMDLQFHFVAERSQSLSSIIDNLNQMDGVNVELGKNEIIVR